MYTKLVLFHKLLYTFSSCQLAGFTCVVFFFPSEIQELDSQMQYLVYENHSKFIKASETIREVQRKGRKEGS